ncbi:MAG: DUF6538 domain-containing protein [Cyclobacteriaceae bacterium]
MKRGNTYYLNRRVPTELKEYDLREIVRISLKTDSLKLAEERYTTMNLKLEAYWDSLVHNFKKHSHDQFNQLVKKARLFGFRYMPTDEVAKLSVDDLIWRIQTQDALKSDKESSDALLGTKND